MAAQALPLLPVETLNVKDMSTTPSEVPSLLTKQERPLIIAIAGGSASGKTQVAERIASSLKAVWGPETVGVFSQDCFYKDLTKEQLASVASYNWDHPDAFDWEETFDAIKVLREGGEVCIPAYDYANNRRHPIGCGQVMAATRAIIVEGIFILYDPELRKLFDIKLFVDVDDDERLCRRLERDVQQRGRDVDGVLAQYERFVKPAFDAYISGTKEHADLIIPQGAKNEIGLGVIVDVVAENFLSYVQ